MALFRCTWVGTFNNGEQWSTGLWVQTTTDEDARDLIEAVGDAYTNSPWDIAGALHPGDRVEKLVAYKHASPSGNAIDQAEYPINVPGRGGNGDRALPSNVCFAITLRTGAPGASRRGRQFIPMRFIENLDAQGKLSPAFCNAQTAAYASFLGGVNLVGIKHAVVVSRTTGEVRNITSVEVGNIVDNQSSRRRQIVESRTSSPVSQV